MSVLYTNNAKTTLSADLSNSATSLGVASSSGFPSLSGSHYFYATLDDTTNLEVVKVTAVSGTTWTIVRAQDNTTARAYNSGDTVELRLNAALLTDVVNDALASSFTRQEFTGNGSTTAYTLNKTPNSENDLLVFIEGVFQTQSVYSLSGTTLTFSTAPANTRKIIVYHVSASVSGDSLALNTFSGNGSTTAFTMSVDPLYENNTMVFIDGVYQNKSTYATSGTTLTFDTAPANGTSIDVTTHTQQTVNVPVDGSVSTAKVADDAVTLAKMAANSVDSDQYVDASIDTAHIKDAQVTTAKLAADAVTAAKLADNAVVTANIADDQVTTAKIADDQVTLAKLAGLARGKIIYGDSSGNPAALALGSNGQVLKSDGTDIAWATDATVAALTSEQVQDIAGAMFSSNTETGITATYQDGDGTIDLVLDAAQTNITSLGTLTALTVDDITIDGSTISDASHLTIDAEGVIKLDANGGEIQFLDGGTEIGVISMGSQNINIESKQADKDIVFKGIDGSSDVTALTLDMSDAGRALFNGGVRLSGLNAGTGLAFDMAVSGDYVIKESSTSDVMSFQGALFHNFSNNRIGIGTASPSNLLHVNVAGSNDVGTTISNGQYDYTWGIDTSDSAQFKLSRHTGLGNYDLIKFHPTTYNAIIPSGSLHIGTTSTTGVASGGLRLTFPSNESDGDLFFVSNGGGSNATPVLMYVVQGESFSTNHGAMAVGKHTGNSRSINAGGTINASGADYAEYMVKSSGCGDIAKGDVVGVDSDGKLTKTFSAAKSFVIKSTDPSYVGGDTWWTEKEPEPKYTDDTKSTKTDNFKDWETSMETARSAVDRIAFSGQVPVNITGSFNVGDYVYPQVNSTGIKAVAKSSPTFEEYQLCVGKIWATMDDGRPLVAVKIG